MNTLSYKTVSINKETAKKEWVVIFKGRKTDSRQIQAQLHSSCGLW